MQAHSDIALLTVSTELQPYYVAQMDIMYT